MFSVPLSLYAKTNQKKLISETRDWQVWSHTNTCYMVSKPQKSSGKYTKRDEVWLMLQKENNKAANFNLSFIAGYPFRSKCDTSSQSLCFAELHVNNQIFYLYTHNDTAWMYPEDATKLLPFLQKGSKLTIKATSSKGTATEDIFSLAGFSDSFTNMQQCK